MTIPRVVRITPCLSAALSYARRGWAVFPLNGKQPYPGTHGHKDATTSRKQIRRWWRKWPLANVGIACNSVTGPIVLDVDGASGAALVESLDLPPTRTARSRAGRAHLYFNPMEDGTRIKRTIKVRGTKLDILGDGGYVVAPPSVHPETGKPYRWTNKSEPTALPRAVFRLLKNSQVKHVAPPLPEVINTGERDTLLTSLAGTMRRRGASPESILAALRAENAARVRPPLKDTDLRRIAQSIGTKQPGSREDQFESVIINLGRVERTPVKWLAEGFLPLGKFCLIEGDPGLGKSTLTLDIAARITRGESVLGSPARRPANVVLVTLEDGLSDTVRPRVDALGGNPRRVFVFHGVRRPGDPASERPPILPDDVARLKRLIKRKRAVLVIVDPLSATLSERTDSHNDASVRRVTALLSRLAESTGACVLGIRHLIKGTAANAIRAGGGSIAFAAAARAVYRVGEHPDDAELSQSQRRRVLASVKNNLAPARASEMFRLTPHGELHQAVIEWLGKTEVTADDLHAAQATFAANDRSENAEVDDWLREILAKGRVPATVVFGEGKRAGGWTPAQLRRSLKRIGGAKHRAGYGPGAKYHWQIGSKGRVSADTIVLR